MQAFNVFHGPVFLFSIRAKSIKHARALIAARLADTTGLTIVAQ